MAALTPFAPVQQTLESLPRSEYWAVGYSLIDNICEKQLRNGQSAVIDCVARFGVEQRWAAAAAERGARFTVIECCCSDEAVHRGRIEWRKRDIPGWYELEWEGVRRGLATYEPLAGEKLVVDAVDPLDINLARVRAYVGITNGRLEAS
jgi:predicted kinase